MTNMNPLPSSNPYVSPLDPASEAPRKPWLAMLASLVLPGLGQFYNGELNRAIWLFLTFALLSIPGFALVTLYLPDGWMVPALAVGLLMTLGIWMYGMWQAWRTARNTRDYRLQPWQISGVYALVFVLCDLVSLPLLTLYVREHQVEPFRIPSHSMEPSVMQGDYIFADKRYNCPGCRQGVHRGDIAIFANPNDRSVRYIRRVVALPGDMVEYRDQYISVNGQPLQTLPNSAIADTQNAQTTPRSGPVSLRVPDGQVFVLGDNRSASVDSRTFGTVPLQDILGRARQVWFSSDQGSIRWDRLGVVLQ